MKIGDVGYVKFGGMFYRYEIVSMHEALGGTLTIKNGTGTATCRISEFIPEQQYFEDKLRAEEPEARERLKPILDAWEAGAKTHTKVKEHLAKSGIDLHVISICSKMRECHRRGFFTLPVVDGMPSTK